MSYTERFSEVHIPLYVLHPISVNAGPEAFTTWVDMANYHRAVVLINTGVMAGGSTLNANLHQATDATGAGVKYIYGKWINQLSQAGGDSDSLVAIELKTEELDVEGGFHFIALGYTVANAAILLQISIIGIIGRYEPGPQTGFAEVVD